MSANFFRLPAMILMTADGAEAVALRVREAAERFRQGSRQQV